MFKITALICFLGMGSLQQNLCFNADIPHLFPNTAECMEYVKASILKLDKEFVKRKVTMAFKCETVLKKMNETFKKEPTIKTIPLPPIPLYPKKLKKEWDANYVV